MICGSREMERWERMTEYVGMMYRIPGKHVFGAYLSSDISVVSFIKLSGHRICDIGFYIR